MRKQYHFRPCGQRFDAWDVDRLIRLSRDLPVREVHVASIDEVDTAYWFGGDQPTVRRVVEHMSLVLKADLAHPIIVAADGRVMDGMHRVARALLDGVPTVKAVRFRQPVEPDHRDCLPDDLPY